jgi:TonB family protein
VKTIGKYEILRELGRGAMGVVFKARDPLIGRLVALKTIALAASESEDLRQRFYREAQAAGGLQHPNIVTIYEMGEEAGVPFIAMEYLEGESLDAVLSKNKQIPRAQKIGYLVQICRALSYAHQHGIVHRDIKPGNVVVTRGGTVKVVDFGIARIVDTSKTQTGVVVGTLAYMSPQLLKGERADERSDIWAVGVLCYEMFAGQKPFDGNNHAALLLSILSDEPRALAEVSPDCPEELRVIVEKMLRKNAQERYQSFEELLRTAEPVWRKHQRECVDSMLGQSQDLIGRGELPAARKVLLQARLVDGTHTLTREMLETVNAALKDALLPAEVEERLERARNLRSEGLLEEARAEAKSALELDSKSESARRLLSEIAREIELLQETKEKKRAPALDRLLTAMRAAIQQGRPSEAIRLGREALGRAGHDTRVSELVELAERKLREGDSGAGRKKAGDVEIPLYPKDGRSEELIREYVFERVGAKSGGSDSSLPRISAQPVEASARSVNSRLASKSSSAPASQESTTKKHAAQRSGTMVVPEPAEASPARRPWKKTLVYATLTIVVVGAAAAIEWRRRLPAPSPPTVPVAQATAAPAEEHPKEPIVVRPTDAASDAPMEPLKKRPREKNDEEQLFAQAQQLAQSADPASLHQAQNLLERVIATNGAHRSEAAQLRDDVLRRLSKNEQDLQRNQQFSALATQARRYLDTGDAASARAQLSEIHRLGGDDENLAAEIARTERARFASLESEYQQDVQSADERARNHLSDLQRQFRVLADSGGPLAASAKNYAENLIPAKISEIGAKIAAAGSNVAENQAFDGAVKEYKKFLESRDPSSLKTVVLPRFQTIVQGGGAHSADARQYVDNLIPAAIRQLAPYPAIGCAEVPSGLAPSVKSGELVACGLLDPPRLKWAQFSWPEFPARARQAGQIKGVAMLTLTVDENGNVLEAKTRGRSDAYGFADAAVQAAQGWKTSPPRAQNKAVRTQFSVDVSFSQ